MEHIKGLLGSIQFERERLAQNQHVPVDEVRGLVFTSYSCGMVTEGRASQLLCMDRLEFRQELYKWLGENDRISTILNAVSAFG